MVQVLQAEWEACAVSSGSVALFQLACGEPYDVILLDMHMPDMDGMEFYDVLLDYSPALANRVVIVTAGETRPAQRAFVDAFPNEVLNKPFMLDELRKVVGWASERLSLPLTFPPRAA